MSTFIIIIFLSLMMGKSGGAIRPVVTFTPNWGNILQGDGVTLRCDVPSSVPEEPRTYHWYKDGRTIHRDEQILQMESSAKRDSGDYQCRINTGDISDLVTLNVTDPPGGTVTRALEGLTALSNELAENSGWFGKWTGLAKVKDLLRSENPVVERTCTEVIN
ncbi:low affinity immunoglobulin gamma Fc region receptor III-A-like [Aquarana catesbeiana]|uniref:low affinity immunoglobulin gamma Fc region receptor III-A-like n=1 Tax=Aquarana catesbeiana TaxID=8400 RepID=UPI003CC9D28B